MVERRKSERIPVNHPVLYLIPNSKGQVETQGIGVALDISTDGMMFESNEPVEAMVLFIHASSSDGSTMKVEGLLVYSMPHANGKYRTGLKFKGASEKVSTFVGEILKKAHDEE